MKFKSIQLDRGRLKEFNLRWNKSLKNGNLLLVAGSTHQPEEEIILEVYQEIIRDYPKLSLLICPRHLRRVPLIVKIAENQGFCPMLVSTFSQKKEEVLLSRPAIFILDTTGELVYFYSLADIVFVGGSLSPYGGHNILEPAYFSKPIIFGEFMFNFEEIRSIFLQRKACLEVKNRLDFKESLISLISNQALRKELGQRARLVLDDSGDAVDENIKIMQNFLK